MKHTAALLGLATIIVLGFTLTDVPSVQSQSNEPAATQPDNPAPATRPSRQPSHMKFAVIHVSDSDPMEYLLLVGDSVAFRRIESLKRFIADLPPGSSLTWAPGCSQLGDEPLLSSSADMDDFKKHCEKHQVKLIIIPSG